MHSADSENSFISSSVGSCLNCQSLCFKQKKATAEHMGVAKAASLAESKVHRLPQHEGKIPKKKPKTDQKKQRVPGLVPALTKPPSESVRCGPF